MSATATDVREQAEEHLRRLVGRDDVSLHDDQWAAIEALAVDRRRALVVQRTGWGKSAVYFVATLLLRAEGPDGLTRQEIEDNIITFIGAGHETTARALGWTLYCLAGAPWERARIEVEIDAVLEREPDPTKWLDAMPFTRAAFEACAKRPDVIPVDRLLDGVCTATASLRKTKIVIR